MPATKPLWAMADERAADARLAELLGGWHETARDPRFGAYGYFGAGSRVNQRTHDALVIAAHLSGWGPLELTQGGLNDSAVPDSAKTHDGLDVGDVRSKGRSRQDIFDLVDTAALCGAYLFIRGEPWDAIDDGMVEHLHGVMGGAQQAHPDARAQLYDSRFGYAHGGGGLAGAPWFRWFGPRQRPVIEWSDSRYNPANGWRP